MRGFFIYDLAEHFPRAPKRLYEGRNLGKQIVRVDPAAR
jgi:NADPH-dependent curcumin reductase CurA